MRPSRPRLAALTAADLDVEQRALWDHLAGVRAEGEQTDASGGLVGPFNAFLRAPELFTRLMPAGQFLRDGTVVERRLMELAICSVATYWRAEFEFWQHAPMAIACGIDPAILEALRVGQVPEVRRDDERAVHALTTQLISRHRVDDATYAAALEALGERGVVELIAAVGFYTLIAMLLNLFEVPTPDAESVFP